MNPWIAAFFGVAAGLSLNFFWAALQSKKNPSTGACEPLAGDERHMDLRSRFDALIKKYETQRKEYESDMIAAENTIRRLRSELAVFQDDQTAAEEYPDNGEPAGDRDFTGKNANEKLSAAGVDKGDGTGETSLIQRENERLRSRIVLLEKELREKERGMEKFQRELDMAKSSSEAEIRNLQADLAIAGERYEQALREFDGRKEELEKRLFALQTELELFADNSEVQPVRSELIRTHEQLQKERSAIDMLVMENKKLAAELEALRSGYPPPEVPGNIDNPLKADMPAVQEGL